MKKIVHVGYAHSPDDTRILEKECLSLIKNKNYQVTYVTSTKSGVAAGDFDDRGVAIRVLPLKDKRYVRLVDYLFDLKKELLDMDADLYHIHEPWLLPIVAPALKRRGKTVIFDMHEFYREQFRQRRGAAAQVISRFYNVYERSILPKLDAVIAPCTMLGKDPAGDDPRKKPTVYIDNVAFAQDPDPDALRAADEVIDKLLKDFDPGSAPVVTYAGTLSESRGITSSIIAAHRAGARIVLAGQFGSSEYEQKLRSMPEWECVTYVGTLTRTEVFALNRRCDIGIAVLQNVGQYFKGDNLPTKVHEYMQQGIPVVLYNTPFVQRLLKEYRFGIAVDPSDPDAIAKAIRTIADDPRLAEEMRAEGLRAVKERFSWQREEEKLFALYRELLGE